MNMSSMIVISAILLLISSTNCLLQFKSNGQVWFYYYFVSFLSHSDNQDQFSHSIFQSQVQVQTIWSSNTDSLLQFQISDLKLYGEDRVEESIVLENFNNFINIDVKSFSPFLVHLSNSNIYEVYLSKNETIFSSNFKRGVATLFQFQLDKSETSESDPIKKVRHMEYYHVAPNLIMKNNMEYTSDPDTKMLLVPKITSNLTIEYQLDKSGEYFSKIVANESITIQLPIKRKYFLNNLQQLHMIESKIYKLPEGDDIDAVIENVAKYYKVKLMKKGLRFEEEITGNDSKDTKDDNLVNIKRFLNDSQRFLHTEFLATNKSAEVFLKLYNLAKLLSVEQLSVMVNEYHEIRLPIIDLLGYLGTKESHTVAKKVINFKKSNHIDQAERYLWALAIGQKPNDQFILKDLLTIFQSQKNDFDNRLCETLILTITSMASKLKTHQVYEDVQSYILTELEKPSDQIYRITLINSLLNLKSEKCVQVLHEIIARDPNQLVGAKAMKVINSLPKSYWNYDKYRDLYFDILYQLRKKHDSSARIFALDIILEMEQDNGPVLAELLQFLLTKTAFEVKQYLIQKLQLLSETNSKLRDQILEILSRNSVLKYYGVKFQPGLSTILQRDYFKNIDANCTITSIQEIFQGIVKRGIVNIDFDYDHQTYQLFSLGLFSSGLSSFISSSTNEDDDLNDYETEVTAGMQLSILESHLRPFVFFNGNGELMGHVWSGTASDKTPALQQLLLLIDYVQKIKLRFGLIIDFIVQSTASFDLSGQIVISIWNRNSYSSIQKKIGIFTKREIIIKTPANELIQEYHVEMEPNLDLLIDVDFSSEIALCLRLRQPTLLIREKYVNRRKTASTDETTSQILSSQISGKSYNLNEKNNKMCNQILQNV